MSYKIRSTVRVAANPLARLIKKIYEVDPLACPKCKGQMRIIAFIEDYKVKQSLNGA